MADYLSILEKYKDNIDLRNAVIKLKNSLDNDKNISIIAEDTGLSRLEIKALFEEISDKEVKEWKSYLRNMW